jgi:FtsP/CotA-like multicopper oxidase with cupredoxin domain
MHLAASDGYVRMADGHVSYVFGFSDVTGMLPEDAVKMGMFAANFPAPTIELDEGDEFYLTLTNSGMMVRNDLFDPHVVHFHGFPNAASVFDGVPDASIGVNMGSSFTYYYKIVVPGTFMWHCHVEAVEHMQMGMLGQLFVRPAQNKLPDGTNLNGFVHHTGFKYAYNDGDGSTLYDVDMPIQVGSFDSRFHDYDETYQPPPFAQMYDDYGMLNGRGYPDTVNPLPLVAPAENGGIVSQKISSLVKATQGQKILLRISNLNVTREYTIRTTGLPLRVVGRDAKLLRGPTGVNHFETTYSYTSGGGQSTDAIIDTAGVPKGTYFLYTSNLNYLSNKDEDFGGMMTEIVIQ